MFSSKSDLWETPQDFFDNLDKEFHFTLDACALPENAKCKRYIRQRMMDSFNPGMGSYGATHPTRNVQSGQKNVMKRVGGEHGGVSGSVQN